MDYYAMKQGYGRYGNGGYGYGGNMNPGLGGDGIPLDLSKS